MHLVSTHSDGSCFAVAAFVLMRGGPPSPPRIHFACKVLGGHTNILSRLETFEAENKKMRERRERIHELEATH